MAKPKESATKIEDNGASPKLTRFQRFSGHIKKWWWIYVIAVIVIVLVTVLPILYVGVPHFASAYINKYNYSYTGIAITNPTTDGFHVSQTSKFQSGSFDGHLTAFNASIYSPNREEPMAIFPVPEISFGGDLDFTINRNLTFDCIDCLSQLAASAASNKETYVVAKGDPYLKAGSLPKAHLNIDKTLPIKGYDVQEYVNSHQFNVSKFELLNGGDFSLDKYNVNCTVLFANPSPYYVEMGSTSFNLSLKGSDIGYVVLPNLTVDFNITETVVLGSIDLGTLLEAALLTDSSEGAVPVGTVTVGIKGNRSEVNGKVIPYYTAAIQAIQVSVTVNLLDYGSLLFDHSGL